MIDIANINRLTVEEQQMLMHLLDKCVDSNNNELEHNRVRSRTYYFIDDEGFIRKANDIYDKSAFRFSVGNYFSTSDGAKFARKKSIIIQKLKDYALDHNVNSHPLYAKGSGYIIVYDIFTDNLVIVMATDFRHTEDVIFSSYDVAQGAIASIGTDNIKRYLFNIT